MDMSMESTSQKTSSRSAVSKDMELQVCVCGWSKATTVRGLKIHQGRMKCLREKGQGPRIDQYFLRSQSSQSNEIQRQEANHSSQDISTPVIDVRRTCMDTVSDEPNDPCEPGETCADSSDVFLFAAGRGRQPIDIRLSVMAVTRRGLPIENITGAEALVESYGDGEPQKKKRETEQSISSSRGETLGSPVGRGKQLGVTHPPQGRLTPCLPRRHLQRLRLSDCRYPGVPPSLQLVRDLQTIDVPRNVLVARLYSRKVPPLAGNALTGHGLAPCHPCHKGRSRSPRWDRRYREKSGVAELTSKMSQFMDVMMGQHSLLMSLANMAPRATDALVGPIAN
ncbi:UNVERIFIED_CONTAM: hypothetical protein FKN15_013025 [Acipenser sinensis]